MKKKTENEIKKTYYISDLHLGDKRVFDLCKRNYTADEFDALIVENWNNIVMKNDEVYLLGDVLFENYFKGIDVLKKLNGVKHLIIGNHDLPMLEELINSKTFKTINYQRMINDNGENVFLCHYPIMDWPDNNIGSHHIYGHIHNKDLKEIKSYYKNKNAYNASCDVTGFMPKTLDELIKLKEEEN